MTWERGASKRQSAVSAWGGVGLCTLPPPDPPPACLPPFPIPHMWPPHLPFPLRLPHLCPECAVGQLLCSPPPPSPAPSVCSRTAFWPQCTVSRFPSPLPPPLPHLPIPLPPPLSAPWLPLPHLCPESAVGQLLCSHVQGLTVPELDHTQLHNLKNSMARGCMKS